MPNNKPTEIPDILYHLADPDSWSDFGFLYAPTGKRLAHEVIQDLLKRWQRELD